MHASVVSKGLGWLHPFPYMCIDFTVIVTLANFALCMYLSHKTAKEICKYAANTLQYITAELHAWLQPRAVRGRLLTVAITLYACGFFYAQPIMIIHDLTLQRD